MDHLFQFQTNKNLQPSNLPAKTDTTRDNPLDLIINSQGVTRLELYLIPLFGEHKRSL